MNIQPESVHFSRGWSLSEGRMSCIHPDCGLIPQFALLYETGACGVAYCHKHAPEDAWSELEKEPKSGSGDEWREGYFRANSAKGWICDRCKNAVIDRVVYQEPPSNGRTCGQWLCPKCAVRVLSRKSSKPVREGWTLKGYALQFKNNEGQLCPTIFLDSIEVGGRFRISAKPVIRSRAEWEAFLDKRPTLRPGGGGIESGYVLVRVLGRKVRRARPVREGWSIKGYVVRLRESAEVGGGLKGYRSKEWLGRHARQVFSTRKEAEAVEAPFRYGLFGAWGRVVLRVVSRKVKRVKPVREGWTLKGYAVRYRSGCVGGLCEWYDRDGRFFEYKRPDTMSKPEAVKVAQGGMGPRLPGQSWGRVVLRVIARKKPKAK